MKKRCWRITKEGVALDMNDNGYYWVKLKDEMFNRDVIALFKRDPNGLTKTSCMYRLYLKPLFGYKAYKIYFRGLICLDYEISEIRPCNENEKALLNHYYDKYREMNSID